MLYCSDVTARRHDLAPMVASMSWGRPASPAALPGKQGKGITYPRSKAFCTCVAYIAAQQPSHRLLSNMACLEEEAHEPGLQPEVQGPGHPTLQDPGLVGRRQERDHQTIGERPLPGRDPCTASGPRLG